MRELQKLAARVVWSSYSSQFVALTIIYDGSSQMLIGAATLAFRVKAIDPLTPTRIKMQSFCIEPGSDECRVAPSNRLERCKAGMVAGPGKIHEMIRTEMRSE